MRVRVTGVERHPDPVQTAWKEIVDAARIGDSKAIERSVKKWDDEKFAATPKENIAKAKKKAEDVAKQGDEIIPDLTKKPKPERFTSLSGHTIKDGIKEGLPVDKILEN